MAARIPLDQARREAARAGEPFTVIDHEDRGTGPGETTGKPNGTAPMPDLSSLCLSPAEWEAREIEPEDLLLGPFSTTTRTELSADTGLGKTMVGLGLVYAKALGCNFLHWEAARRGRCLFIDGEMPCGLIKGRLKVARSWFGLDEPLSREWLCVLSREDVPDMPPFDTPEGARYVLNLIEQLGRFDHVTFDNRACLAIGDLAGEDASTTALKVLQREITKLRTGQTWLHHTGHDGTRGYGRKAREWELDTVMVGERLTGRPNLDVGMRLTFSKARRRTPDNRADYEPVEIELRQGQWFWQHASGTKDKEERMTPCATVCLNALLYALTELGKEPPSCTAMRRVQNVVTMDQWRDMHARMANYTDDQAEARRKAFQRGSEWLLANRRAGKWSDFVWATSDS